MGNSNIRENARKKKATTQKINLEANETVKELEPNTEYTVCYCWNSFLIDRMARGNSKATIDDYERFYKKLIKCSSSQEGQPSVEELGISVICEVAFREAFICSLGEVSQQTINHYLRSYRAFGNYCEEEGFVDVFKCPIREEDAPLKDVYTEKELNKLLKEPYIRNISHPTLEEFVEYRSYTIITLLTSTGVRSNTILNIRIRDVDLEKGYINFNVLKAKNPFPNGLTPECISALEKYIRLFRSYENTEPEDFLFCTIDENQMSRNALCKSIANYNKSRGVQKTSIHLFRHTFAKMWITSGGDIITLSKVLNHKELEMVKRYSNLYGTDVKKAIEQHSISAQLSKKESSIKKNAKK